MVENCISAVNSHKLLATNKCFGDVERVLTILLREVEGKKRAKRATLPSEGKRRIMASVQQALMQLSDATKCQ